MNDREREEIHKLQLDIDKDYTAMVPAAKALREALLKEPIVIERPGQSPLLYGAFKDGSWFKEKEVEK